MPLQIRRSACWHVAWLPLPADSNVCFRFTFCDEICPSLNDIPHDIYTIYTFISRFFTFLSSPVIIWFIKRGYTIVTVRGKDSDDRNQPIGFGLKNIVPTSMVNITGAGKTAKAALYTLHLSTTKVFIYTSLLFKQNRSVTQGGFAMCLCSWHSERIGVLYNLQGGYYYGSF